MSARIVASLFFGLVLALAGLALLIWLLYWLWTRGRREEKAEVVEIGLEPVLAVEEAIEEPAVAAVAASAEAVSEAPARYAEEPAAVIEPVVEEPASRMQDAPPAAGPDDLKLIEGIGPRIEGVLQAAGIRTFSQLAAADVENLAQILRTADPRLLRLADPASWPEQASLAAAGQWDALTALQRGLRAGRRVGP